MFCSRLSTLFLFSCFGFHKENEKRGEEGKRGRKQTRSNFQWLGFCYSETLFSPFCHGNSFWACYTSPYIWHFYMEQKYNGFIFKGHKIYSPNFFVLAVRSVREMTVGRKFVFTAADQAARSWVQVGSSCYKLKPKSIRVKADLTSFLLAYIHKVQWQKPDLFCSLSFSSFCSQ